jgi:hypothetical protein
MKKFPACDKEELRTVLEENSFCLEDAMGSLELFSSPVKKNSKSKQKRTKCIDFGEVVDCVTIDDNSDIGNNSDDNKNTSDVNKSTSAQLRGIHSVLLCFVLQILQISMVIKLHMT